MKNLFAKYKKEILVFIFAFLLCSTSFALGYLANRELNHAPIIIQKGECK